MCWSGCLKFAGRFETGFFFYIDWITDILLVVSKVCFLRVLKFWANIVEYIVYMKAEKKYLFLFQLFKQSY